jgi:hypothetical protein
MRRIKVGATINPVSLGEVIEYDTGDGVYHKVVAVPKEEYGGCTGCYFDGIEKGPSEDGCIVYYIQEGIRREASLCCVYPGKTISPGNKFCKFIKTGDMMEEL